MAKLYANRIILGRMTLDEVPEKWREAISKLLN